MVICASSRSPILIGMKNPVSPRGATDEPYGSQRRAGNPAYPAQMTAGQGIQGANHGSQCPLTPPGLAATARGESAGGGSRPTSSDRSRHPIRAWRSRGHGFKSRRPDLVSAGQSPLT
jgi:hypothetical protein